LKSDKVGAKIPKFQKLEYKVWNLQLPLSIGQASHLIHWNFLSKVLWGIWAIFANFMGIWVIAPFSMILFMASLPNRSRHWWWMLMINSQVF